jgi:hypothetical protein
VLLHGRDRKHGDRLGGEFFGGERKPVGHMPLRVLCDEKALPQISRNVYCGPPRFRGLSRGNVTHYGRAILMAPGATR